MLSSSITLLLLTALVVLGECSVARMMVQKGTSVPIEFSGSKDIKRTVAAGVQIFHLEAENKGKLTDERGNQLDASNFELSNGTMIIKNVSEADAGSYQECSSAHVKQLSSGGFVGVAGPMIILEIEKDN